MSRGAVPSALARFARTVGRVVALAVAVLVFVVARVGAATQCPVRLPATPAAEAGDDTNAAVKRDSARPQVKSNKRSEARDPFAPGNPFGLGPDGGPRIAPSTRAVLLPTPSAAMVRCRRLVESLPESRAPPHDVA